MKKKNWLEGALQKKGALTMNIHMKTGQVTPERSSTPRPPKTRRSFHKKK